MAQQTDTKKSVKIQEFTMNHSSPLGITRERSFVRTPTQQHQNLNKRRSLAFSQQQHQQQQQQLRGKPALEVYRPPNVRLDGPQNNKLNVHAQEFQMNRAAERLFHSSRQSLQYYHQQLNQLQQSKSGSTLNNLQFQQMQHLQNRSITNMGPRQFLMSSPMQMGVASHMPLVNSPSSGNILHPAPRVKFAPESMMQHPHQQLSQNQYPSQTNNGNGLQNPLQRSKSLSSADAIARGIAGLGLGLGSETTDIGQFAPDVQAVINKASDDPNQLTARCLMELATHVMNRAVEGRRYALPIARLCISIIAKEKKETFLEALLNSCRQWYQERDKVLGPAPNSKVPSRPRFTAFMAFLTEMFCQLKRRQLQLRTQCDGAPPPLVLLTLLGKCCENCVQTPVRSLPEIECLFFVLTCIGRDLETHTPQQLDILLASVRDAFLNSSASAPAIRRTLLQLIELHASRWQLPGNTVLYYYPSSK